MAKESAAKRTGTKKAAKEAGAQKSAENRKSTQKVSKVTVTQKSTSIRKSKQKAIKTTAAKKPVKKSKNQKKVTKRVLNELILKGKQQGYLTFDEINETLPEDLLSSDQIDETLMVERRKVVGSPVHCAEYIPAPLVGELNIAKRYIVQSVRGIKTFLHDQMIKASLTPGFIIKRDVFDQTLVDEACRKGAHILLSTKAVSRNENEVIIKSKSELPAKVNTNIIIGTDGPFSTVGKWINSVNKNLITAVQVRVPLSCELDFTEVYFDNEIFGGYGWLFPKGAKANIGLGIKKKDHKPPPLGKLLNQFISQRSCEGKIEKKPSGLISGWIPAQTLKKTVHENVLLAGDAAGHTHPITGAGIFPAITCGHMAGKWAARAIEAKNLNLLSHYEEEYRDLFGDSMDRALGRRQLMEKKWAQLDDTLKYCWVAFKEYYARTS
ncbi:RNA polymerase sigma factor region1.1 domain-containing protein [Thermodesulfobacteriota bacterium]